jgi:hypothetical protein
MALARALRSCPGRVAVQAVSVPEAAPTLHAKFVLALRPQENIVLSGSANMSLSALCNTVTSGNAELGNSCPRRPVVSQSRQSSLGFKSGALAQEGQKGVGGRRMAVVGAPHHADGSVEGWRRRTHSDCPRRRVAHG